MPEIKIVGRGIDTLVLNVCYVDKQFRPIKQELVEDLQNELNLLQELDAILIVVYRCAFIVEWSVLCV